MLGTSIKAKPKNDILASPSKVSDSPSGGGTSCVVAKGTKIEGLFRTTENVRVDGTLVGDVFCEKKLVLGQDGEIEGKLTSLDAVVMGHIKGEVKINGVLQLVSTAFIEGNIVARKMIVEEGARYNGECKIGE